jgi:hypothetical protein
VRQAQKERSHTIREAQDQNLRAHAIRKSDLLDASSCDSISGFSHPAHPGSKRYEGRNHESKSEKPHTSDGSCIGSAPAERGLGDRQPLHVVNGAVSRTGLKEGAPNNHVFVCNEAVSHIWRILLVLCASFCQLRTVWCWTCSVSTVRYVSFAATLTVTWEALVQAQNQE